MPAPVAVPILPDMEPLGAAAVPDVTLWPAEAGLSAAMPAAPVAGEFTPCRARSRLIRLSCSVCTAAAPASLGMGPAAAPAVAAASEAGGGFGAVMLASVLPG